MEKAPVMAMLAATLPDTDPTRPLLITATWAPPERILPLAVMATSMIIWRAPKASSSPAKMENWTMVLADTEASIP